MFKKIIAIFKLGNVEAILTKLYETLIAVEAVLDYVNKQIQGSAIGDKLAKNILAVSTAIVSIKKTIEMIANIFGIDLSNITIKISLASENKLTDLDKLIKELDQLTKKK
mgnify:CR=1 FL=1